MVDYTEGSGRQYHTGVGPQDIGKYVILPFTDQTGGCGALCDPAGRSQTMCKDCGIFNGCKAGGR